MALGAPALATAPAPLELDPRRIAATHEELPGLSAALDGAAMAARLQDRLAGARSEVVGCEPRRATYLPGRCCILRYDLELALPGLGTTSRTTVTARVLPAPEAARGYFSAHLEPTARRARGHPDLGPLDGAAAVLEEEAIAVAAWPVDGELPTLVDAADHRVVAKIAALAVPRSGERALPIVAVRPGHYGRQHRCVLRYEVHPGPEGRNEGAPVVLYGKVAADGRGRVAHTAIGHLHESMAGRPPGLRFRLPRSLGFYPDLGLCLLEALEGEPAIGSLIKDRARGRGASALGGTLEESVGEAGRVLASLHASEARGGRARRAEDEVAGLHLEIARVATIAPSLSNALRARLGDAEARLGSSAPQSARLGHGDYSHSQLLFDGARSGLVDFDTLCSAEPALDVGHFTAYLRLAVAKAASRADAAAIDAERLCDGFVDAYVAGGGARGEEETLRRRAPAYERLSLIRLALHSWKKLKPERLVNVLSLLDEGP